MSDAPLNIDQQKVEIFEAFLNEATAEAIKEQAPYLLAHVKLIYEALKFSANPPLEQRLSALVSRLMVYLLDDSVDRGYLSIVAIAKDEGPYLAEWLEYHRLVGVEKFYIYDNDSTDNTKEVLTPYVNQGIVEHIPWPGVAQQNVAYNDALFRFRDASEWLAFIDLDEFIVPLAEASIPEFLQALPQNVSQLLIHWRNFGSAGHISRPEGLVIENYQQRAKGNNHFKCIIRPLAAELGRSVAAFPHCISGLNGCTIDEDGNNITGDLHNYCFGELKIPQKIAINHYCVKSKEEFLFKRSRICADGSYKFDKTVMSVEEFFERWEAGDTSVQNPRSQLGYLPHDIHDTTMSKYAASVKEAIVAVKE